MKITSCLLTLADDARPRERDERRAVRMKAPRNNIKYNKIQAVAASTALQFQLSSPKERHTVEAPTRPQFGRPILPL